MKILMLSDVYLPSSIGGTARHVQWLSRELVRRGHEVIIGVSGDKHLPNRDGQIKVYRVEGLFHKASFLYRGFTAKWLPPTADWWLTRQLSQIIEREKPDIIHSHGRIIYSVLPLKRRFRIPMVTTLLDYKFICLKSTLITGNTVCDEPFTIKCVTCTGTRFGVIRPLAAYVAMKLNRGSLTSIDRFIAVSSYMKQVHLPYLGVGDDRVVVIPLFYSPGVDEEIQGGGDFPPDFILFVGSLAPHKGVDVLIKAYRQLNLKTKLVLIGISHPDYHYPSTENILVIGDAPHSLVIDAFRNCRFAIFPSICPESFGTVNLEAMSHKKAAIASNLGGFTDIVVDGDTGILVPPDNPEALANAIQYLWENPRTADDMGRRGYERWRELFSSDVVVPRIEQLYKSLV